MQVRRLTGWLMIACASIASGCAGTVAVRQAAAPAADHGRDGNEFLALCRTLLAGATADASALGRSDGGSAAAVRLGLMNRIETRLDDAANRAGLFESVHPDSGVREAAAVCTRETMALKTDITLDRSVYAALSAIDPALAGLDAADRRFLDRVVRDFRRNGIDRDEAVRAEVRTLNRRMTELAQQFDRNLAGDTRYIEVEGPAGLAGLPDDFLKGHPPDPTGVVRIGTDWPDYYPFMLYAADDRLREQLWRLGMNLGHPANTGVLQELLQVRQRLAGLLGYADWAAYATELLMVGDPDRAQAFIDRAAAVARPGSDRDQAALLEWKRRTEPGAQRVEPWENHCLGRLVKAERYGYDPAMSRRYFDVRKVRQGVLDIGARLFGLSFVPASGADVWHPDVEALDVVQDGAMIGRIYLDLYPRDDKYKSFAMFPLVSGLAGVRPPEAAIVGNFADPSRSGGETPIDHLDVTTFFHEFGHLMHMIVSGRQKYVRFSGVATEWDFVEVPSQLLEEWAWDAEVLRGFATDREGVPIPADLVARMRAADGFGKGLFVRQQMFYAALALGLHRQPADRLDPKAFSDRMQALYSPWPPIADTHFAEGFGHLTGYSSNYYTYLWSLVIAKDLFERFRQTGVMEQNLGAACRDLILLPGGSRDAADMVRDFLGRDFSFEPFERWLGRGE